MSYQHLKPQAHYEDRYDHLTVEWGRRNLASFMKFYDKWFEIMPDEKIDSFRTTFHLNWIYMLFVGNELVERYDKRQPTIREWLLADEAKDSRIALARLQTEPICQHCSKTGLRIIDKSLMRRGDGIDSPEEILFMLKCTHCQKNSAYWEDGTEWDRLKTYCPKCKSVMDEKVAHKAKTVVTTYTCPACSHSYKDCFDFSSKKEKPDPEFEEDRAIFCLTDPKSLEEHRDAKRRIEGLAQLMKEVKEKEDNKDLYDALAKLKKLKIPELSPLLAPVLKKAGYTEFSMDKPELGREVTVGFNCLDSKSDREDYDSRKTLKKLVEKALESTNWRLMSEDIHYRLGYLNGRLRAYENEEELLKLVTKIVKPKHKRTVSRTRLEKNDHTIKSLDSEDIQL